MSNKNRRRNLRAITVNKVKYKWNVSNFNCDGDWGCRFDIWRDGVKIHAGLTHEKSLTPKDVREQIIKLEKEDNE